MGSIISQYPTLRMGLDVIFRGWFAGTFVSVVLPLYVAVRAITLLFVWKTKREREMLCRQVAGCFFRLMFLLNPQVKLVADDPAGVDKAFDEMCKNVNIPGKSPPFVMINHTSMLDAFVYSASMPIKHISGAVTMAKSGLFKIPVFGQILTDCGHLPVYFNSTKLGNFSVDRDAQAAVMAKLEHHIGQGGCLAFYPEGQINRSDASKLQSFRRGSFAMVKKHKMEAWAFLHVGCEDAWPTNAQMGGFNSAIRVKLVKIETDVGPDAEIAEIAEAMQVSTQKEFTTLLEHHKQYLTGAHVKSD